MMFFKGVSLKLCQEDVAESSESPVESIKKICENEVKKQRMLELAIVKNIYTHKSSNDNDNYECDVELKNGGNELRKVPILTPHIGFTWVPNVGDLVLIGYVGGNVNSPVVLGSLYNDDQRPPVNDMDQAICSTSEEGFKQLDFTIGNDNNMKIDSDKGFQWSAGDVRLLLNKRRNEVSIMDFKNLSFWISGSNKGDASIACNNSILIAVIPDVDKAPSVPKNGILIKTDGEVTIKAGKINLSGDVEINGGSIKLKGTNISVEASGPLDLKGNPVNIN
jgi:hypothetical protein